MSEAVKVGQRAKVVYTEPQWSCLRPDERHAFRHVGTVVMAGKCWCVIEIKGVRYGVSPDHLRPFKERPQRPPYKVRKSFREADTIRVRFVESRWIGQFARDGKAEWPITGKSLADVMCAAMDAADGLTKGTN